MEPTTPTVFRSLLTRKVCRYGLIIQPVLIKLDQRDEAYREILSVNGLTQTHNAAPFVSRRGPWSLIRRHATVFLPSPDPPDKSRYACPRIVTDRSIGKEEGRTTRRGNRIVPWKQATVSLHSNQLLYSPRALTKLLPSFTCR